MDVDSDANSRPLQGLTVVVVGLAAFCLLWLHSQHGYPSFIPAAVLLFVLGFICESLLRLRHMAFTPVVRPKNQFGLRMALISVLLAGCMIHNIATLQVERNDTSWRIMAILATFLAMFVNYAIGRWQRTRAIASQRTASALGTPPIPTSISDARNSERAH